MARCGGEHRRRRVRKRQLFAQPFRNLLVGRSRRLPSKKRQAIERLHLPEPVGRPLTAPGV